MKIDARITKMICGDKLKAYASVCFDDSFLIKGINNKPIALKKQVV